MQFDPQLVERQAIYKLLIGCVVPRPIAWVSSISEDAIANVAPFSFFMAVCNEADAHLRAALAEIRRLRPELADGGRG